MLARTLAWPDISRPRGIDVDAKRAKADGQYARRQADEDGLGESGGHRHAGALPVGPSSTGDPEAIQQGAHQVFWGETRPRETEGVGGHPEPVQVQRDVKDRVLFRDAS